jgi:hypothetical protein
LAIIRGKTFDVAPNGIALREHKTTRTPHRGEPLIQFLHRDRVSSLSIERGSVEQMAAHATLTSLFERNANTLVAFRVSFIARRDKRRKYKDLRGLAKPNKV